MLDHETELEASDPEAAWGHPTRCCRSHQPEDKHWRETMRIPALARTAIVPPRSPSRHPAGPPSRIGPILTIGTASPGGTYYVYGAGLAQILTRDLDLPVVMRPTEGASREYRAPGSGRGQARLRHRRRGAAGVERDRRVGRQGARPLVARHFPDVRYALPAPGPAGHQHPLRRRHGRQAHRRRPARRHLGHLFSRHLQRLEGLGKLRLWRLGRPAAQVHARSIDVLAVGAGVPFPSFIELEFKDKVRYIALSPEQIAALRLASLSYAVARARRHISIPAAPLPDGRALQFRRRARRPAERSRLQHRARSSSRSMKR